MRLLEKLNPFRVPTVHAHCDIPCGIYDPEQARIEAESCLKIIQKYHESDDPIFRDRCVQVKEERGSLAKEHIAVLWSDWYKPGTHGEEWHDLFSRAVKTASEVKRSVDESKAQELLSLIDEIDELWKKNNGPSETRVSGRPG